MDASTFDAEKQATIRQLVQQHYPDAHRISVTVSATGEGQHLRWHYSEDVIEPPRGLTPSASRASLAQVDEDGDSQMGDEEERPHTPQPLGAYDPGSVVLTPHKRQNPWQALRRERRIGGGLDWWHDEEGVEERLTFLRDGERGPDGTQGDVDPEQLGPDTRHVYDLLRAQRERHGSPAQPDDDARSIASIASEATVIIDPREPTKQTLFTGEMPIVRQPTRPSDYKWSGTTLSSGTTSSGNSQPQAIRGLSTIQEEGSRSEDDGGLDTHAWPPRLPDFGHVRLFRDDVGNWVRDGSLPPDGDYHIDRSLLPPKVDEASRAASRAARAARTVQLQRTDTELIDQPASQPRVVPVVRDPCETACSAYSACPGRGDPCETVSSAC
ncbi:hypothetical protein C8T65DRAFT_83892 [Cerioporus squamosus]|nr:hypothetical protein C8T65DRAFT_83892 [Cerioporus squamosus]